MDPSLGAAGANSRDELRICSSIPTDVPPGRGCSQRGSAVLLSTSTLFPGLNSVWLLQAGWHGWHRWWPRSRGVVEAPGGTTRAPWPRPRSQRAPWGLREALGVQPIPWRIQEGFESPTIPECSALPGARIPSFCPQTWPFHGSTLIHGSCSPRSHHDPGDKDVPPSQCPSRCPCGWGGGKRVLQRPHPL